MGHAAAANLTPPLMTAAEYLAWEREQAGKHEFDRGEVFAMAGGSLRHNFLSAAVAAELRAALRGKRCHVLSSDQRIGLAPGARYVYADAVVVCGDVQLEPGTSDVIANPGVVVEVLSPSTEARDRGAKWEAYQRVASLTDYVLVSQDAARVEQFRRESDGWRYQLLESGAVLTLAIGASIPVSVIYHGAFELAAG